MKPASPYTKKYLRALPALGMFAGGAGWSLLPRGMFDENDELVRAFIAGAVAAVSTFLLTLIIQRKRSNRIENP